MAEQRPGPVARIHERWRPIAAVLAAVVVLDAAAWFGLVRGMARTSGDGEVILERTQAELERIRSEVAGLERVTSKLACTRSDVDRVFDETLSNKNDRMTRIQRELRDLARARKMDPEAIAYSPGILKESGLVRFQISFPLVGPYETLEDFIHAVEASPNFLVLEEISMQEADNKELKLTIKLVSYFQGPDAASEATPAQPAGRT